METDTILNETTVKLRKADSTARRRKTSFPITWSILALPLVLFFTVPILAIFLKTPLAGLLQTLNDAQTRQAISLSLFTSAATTLLSIVLGTPVAMLLSSKTPAYQYLDTLLDLPTVLPPSVAGIALLMAFGRKGIFGSLFTAMGVNIPFTVLAVIMAQTFVASSYYIKAAYLGFSAVSLDLKQAAALDGANRWQIFWRITMPMSWSSLLSGAVMTWARSLGEFGATIIFAGNFPGRTQTIPLAIYIGFQIDLNVALTLAVILIAFSFLTLIIVKGFLGKRLETND